MIDSTVRTFTDRDGVAWSVRMVLPERVERRLADRRRAVAGAAGALPERRTGTDRRVSPQLRVRLPAEYAHGWLLLASEQGERRRVAPVPANWAQLSETALALLVRVSASEPRPED